MIPAGYMAKRVSLKPNWLEARQVVDVYSVSSCVSKDFTEYIKYWKHNGYWIFDSPEIIQSVARESAVDIEDTSLFIMRCMKRSSKEKAGGRLRRKAYSQQKCHSAFPDAT
jgi:hypothetical protein